MFLLLQGILPVPVSAEYIKEIEEWLAWKEVRDEEMMEKIGNAFITKAEFEKLQTPDERPDWRDEVGYLFFLAVNVQKVCHVPVCLSCVLSSWPQHLSLTEGAMLSHIGRMLSRTCAC